MQRVLTAIALAVLLGGCAHQKPEKNISSSPASMTAPQNAQTSGTSQKVSLPYVFVRHGVEIRVISVEFSQDPAFFMVNATLQEKRGHAVQLSTNFLEARLSSGPVLDYVQYGLGNKILQDTAISMDPNAQASISLYYRLPAANAAPIELHFPTGRWWTSENIN